MTFLTKLLIAADVILLLGFVSFTFESYREQEARATRNGVLGSIAAIVLGVFILIPSYLALFVWTLLDNIVAVRFLFNLSDRETIKRGKSQVG